MAKVTVQKGLTINLGDFNSYRIFYGIEKDVKDEDAGKKELEKKVEAWLDEEETKIRKRLNDKSKGQT